MNPVTHFELKASLAVDAGYERVASLLSELAGIHAELASWNLLAKSKKKMVLIPFSEKARVVEQILLRAEELQKLYPDEEGFLPFRAILYNKTTEKDATLNPGGCNLVFNDRKGVIQLLGDSAHFGRPVYSVRRDILAAIARNWELSSARTNVYSAGQTAETSRNYETHLKVFPHRDYIGWMGYVPHEIAADDLPEAAELVPIKGKGTVVVTVADNFDLDNPTHVAQANKVEVKLAELGMLPVVDKSLL